MKNSSNSIAVGSLALLLLVTVGSGSPSFALEENPSFHQIVADATSFLRKKKSLDQEEQGKKCVRDALKKLEHDDDESTILKYEKLLAIMKTDLYQEAASSCKAEIELYDKLGGVVCLAEKESNYTGIPATYAQFWGGLEHYGYVFYDGALDLATMFKYTNNFTLPGPNVPCLADCYFEGGNGCGGLETWLPYAGAVSVEQYCVQKWSKIDYAYGALRVCAAKAIANPTDGTTKEEYANQTEAMINSNDKCAMEYWENVCKPLKIQSKATPPQ